MRQYMCERCGQSCSVHLEDLDTSTVIRMPGRIVWPADVPAELRCTLCDWTQTGVIVGLELDAHVHFAGQPDEQAHVSIMEGRFEPRPIR